MDIQELKTQLDEARTESHKALMAAPVGMDIQTFEAYMQPYYEKVEALSLAYRLVETPVMSEIESFGDHMPLEDFISYCKDGSFIDYDGSGNYATADKESNISVYPSDVTSGMLRKDFTHVVWYNR